MAENKLELVVMAALIFVVSFFVGFVIGRLLP